MNRNEDGRGRRLKPYAVLAALVLAASATLAACGGDDDDDGGAAAEGGEVTISQTSQPDYLDPALSYTVNGIEPLWLVYTPLLTYPHVEGAAGAELIPGLAEDLPKISADGKTYTLTLRDGLKFSDGTDVKASDFEHTIKRVLNLESGGSAFYQTIEGATEYLEKGDPEGDISGIETNDQTGEITIKLTEADASFSNILAMWFAGIVPSDTPFKNLTEDPPPGVGPFMITESVPNRQFVLEKNPEFEALNIPGHPGPGARQDHDADHQERQPAGPGRARQQARLHAGPAPGGPEADRDRAGRRPLRGVRDLVDLLLVHGQPVPRRSTTRWFARRSTTGSTSRRWHACSRARCSRGARSCPPACPATTRRSTPPSARTGTRSSRPTSPRRRT